MFVVEVLSNGQFVFTSGRSGSALFEKPASAAIGPIGRGDNPRSDGAQCRSQPPE